ncbi:MAG: RNA polymerase sigma factor [Bacteroidales bacterium]|nr:RNA polymerase sigma factor [Bacteroidales bacterium]
MEDFKSVIDKYYPLLYKIGRSFTNNKADFDDLYQEMLIQVYHSMKQFKGKSKMSTWIYRVALNSAISYSRKHKRKEREISRDNFNLHENSSDEKNDVNEREKKIELLYESINELKKDERALILLHLEGKQYDEIAEIMGISRTNTGVKIMRIRKKLQRILTKKGYERI